MQVQAKSGQRARNVCQSTCAAMLHPQIGEMKISKIAPTLAACAALGMNGTASAGEPIVLKPSGQWNMNYAEESCQLARKFGVGDQETLLQFEMFGPGETFSLLISGRLLKFQENNWAMPSTVLHPTKKVYLNTTFQFLPSGMATKLPGIPAQDQSNGLPTLITGMRLRGYDKVELALNAKPPAPAPKETAEALSAKKAERLAIERSTNALLLEQPFNTPIRFEMGSLGQPFAALAACTDDLMKSWGLQTDAEHLMVNPPEVIGNPLDWWKGNDKFWIALFRNKENSIIYFRLMLNEAGIPERCVIQDSTQTKEFKDASCKLLMEKARFKPGTNAAGTPVKSVYRSSIRYVSQRNPLQL